MIHRFKINGETVSHRDFCQSAGLAPIPRRKGILRKFYNGAGLDIVYIPPRD